MKQFTLITAGERVLDPIKSILEFDLDYVKIYAKYLICRVLTNEYVLTTFHGQLTINENRSQNGHYVSTGWRAKIRLNL